MNNDKDRVWDLLTGLVTGMGVTIFLFIAFQTLGICMGSYG